MEMLERRLETLLKVLEESIVSDRRKVDGIECLNLPCASVREAQQRESGWEPYGETSLWGGRHAMAWFRFRVRLPEDFKQKKPVVLLKMKEQMKWENYRPQFMVYLDGRPVQGADINHREIFLGNRLPGERLTLYLNGYAGEDDIRWWLGAECGLHCRKTELLYYRLKPAYDVMMQLPEGDLRRETLLKEINQRMNQLPFSSPGSPEFEQAVEEALKVPLAVKKSADAPRVFAVGHTHIDVAWLWTVEQTRQKAARSFQTVLKLMEEFPQYRFTSSQPVLYQFVKEDHPLIYEQIKERIAEGRWEAEGAMYLEADCNLTSGESLVRQLLYGKRFFKQEFGLDSRILWLPDVFGYSGNLPQILRRSGVDFFITSKISWNQYNRVPHDLFYWQGIDGSRIPCAFITAPETAFPEDSFFSTYNGKMDAKSVFGTWKRFQDKGVCDAVILPYGYGDGGGGTTREMVLYADALKEGISGCPSVEFTGIKDYADYASGKLEKTADPPYWQGELYLEFHRGTYTSNARIKRNNRKTEYLLRDIEYFGALAGLLSGEVERYPAEALYELHRRLMIQQFHDILPGSSIEEVYEDSEKEFREIGRVGNRLLAGLCEGLMAPEEGTVTVWNPGGMAQSGEAVLEDGRRIWAEDVPPWGWKKFALSQVCKPYARVCKNGARAVTADLQASGPPSALETDIYRVRFDENGMIVSLYDKAYEREVLIEGGRANLLAAYEDIPYEYDNWELSPYYTQKRYELNSLDAWETDETDPLRTVVRTERKFMHSRIRQEIVFYRHSRRIDFVTEADWQEHHLFLKAEFPVQINNSEASYEIAFGSIRRPVHRNTSWDFAKYEVCAHRWADYSEGGYGVALLNDCKYGYDVHEQTMKISLIKAGTYPNPNSDQGCHRFTYALLPHGGGSSKEVIRQAENLNRPLMARTGAVLAADTFSLVSCVKGSLNVSAVKKAEDGDALIIRLYEYDNARGCASVRFGLPLQSCAMCSLMEEEESFLAVEDHEAAVPYRPFEVITLKCRFGFGQMGRKL